MKKRLLAGAMALAVSLTLAQSAPARAAGTTTEPLRTIQNNVTVVGEHPTVICGTDNRFIVRSDGALMMWGTNSENQLGNGWKGDTCESTGQYYWQTFPIKVMDKADYISNDAVIRDDAVWAPWLGYNYGLTKEEIAEAKNGWKKETDGIAAVGGYFADNGIMRGYVIKSDGSLWSDGDIKEMENVVAVSGNMALQADGTLWNVQKCGAPVKLMDEVVSVSEGAGDFVALRRDRSLWVSGDYFVKHIPGAEVGKPHKLMDDVKSFAALRDTIAAVKNDGSLWMAGGDYRQDKELVDPWYEIYTFKIYPVKVLDGVETVTMGDGNYGGMTYAALKTDGTLWMWGDNENGQLGNGTEQNSMTPSKVLSNVFYMHLHEWGSSMMAIQNDGSVWEWGIVQTTWENFGENQLTPRKIPGVTAKLPTKLVPERVVPMAYPSTQTVLVDGTPVEFQMYALKDAGGNGTNYIKLRDLAYILNGTAAQFDLGWDNGVSMRTGAAYVPNGTEMNTPYSDPRPYTVSTAKNFVNGREAALDAFLLVDDAGGGYTYYKLRDLGQALGFGVAWDSQRSMAIVTTK